MNVFQLDEMRVERALHLARKIQLKSGHDAGSFRALRQIFADELDHFGRQEVFSAAMARLTRESPSRHWILAAKAHAGSVFEDDGRLLAAVAAPVTVSLKGPKMPSTELNQGDAEELGFLADRTVDVMGARQVIFGRQIFTLQDVLLRRPNETLAHCRELLRQGPGQPVQVRSPGAGASAVRATPSGPWELLFFFGVVEMDLNAQLVINDAKQAERLRVFSMHAKNAILSAPSLMFNRDIRRDGAEHGVVLQADAAVRGEQGLLVHEVHSFLSNLDLGDENVKVTCCEAEPGRCFRLLAATGLMTTEMVWRSIAGVSSDGLLAAVKTAARILGFDDYVIALEPDLTSYTQEAQRSGLRFEEGIFGQ
jgi:hypothetical protein